MSWVPYLKLAVIVCVGSSLTVVQGLAQQRQVVAQATSGDENYQPEAIDQPNEVTPAIDRTAPLKGAAAATKSNEAAAVSARAPGEADATIARSAPVPPALFLPGADRLSLLDQAYLDAYSILRRNDTCSRFYGGSRVIEALNELKKQLTMTTTDPNIAVRMSGVTMSVTSLKYGFSYRLFDKAELNLRGSFFHGNTFRHDQSVPAIGIFQPNTREARVAILLHELGHLIEKSGGAWLLPNDGNNGSLSQKNTLRVLAACGDEIRGLNGASFEAELQASRPVPDSVVQANVQQ